MHCRADAGARSEILALRPAPVQLGFALGFAGTLGADFVDYLVVDPVVIGRDERFASRDEGPDRANDDDDDRARAAPSTTPHHLDECVLALPGTCCLNGHARSPASQLTGYLE